MIDNLILIQEHCDLSKIKFYVKVHCTQAPLEALLSLLLFIWGVIASNNKMIVTDNILIIPLMYAAATMLLYLFIINYIFLKTLLKFIRENCVDQHVDIAQKFYDTAERKFKSVSIIIHILGVVCYGINTLIYLLYVSRYIEDRPIVYYVILFVIGCITGMLWNIRGYYGDMRIDWCKLFVAINNLKLYEIMEHPKRISSIQQIKLKYTCKHIIINFATSVIMTMIFGGFLLFPIGGKSLINTVAGLDGQYIGTYGFFIFLFLVAFIFYLKTLYPLFYIAKDSIYCEFNDLFHK